MPVYQYECPHCGLREEAEMPMHERHARRWCQDCLDLGTFDVRPMERVVSATSFVLKGGGWSGDGYGSKR